jgi:hypothetical protein
MYHELLRDTSFWEFLLEADQELAEDCRKEGCCCGGRLHRANYLRKPRGGPRGLPKETRYRLSFCCDRDGCRKRVTPPSVRFLGRKVYLFAVVILVSAMRQGPTPRRLHELTKLFGVDRQTIYRWREFWNKHFPRTTFWREARTLLVPVFEMVELPRSLLEVYVPSGDDRVGWKNLLRFLSPISIAKGLAIKISVGPDQPAEDADRRA